MFLYIRNCPLYNVLEGDDIVYILFENSLKNIND